MYQGKYERKPDAPAAAQTKPVQAAPAPTAEAAPRRPVRRRPPVTKRRSSKRGTLIFYSAYAAVILVFFIVIATAMMLLDDWLVKYEASQPNHARDQVFSQLFDDPDWASLYRLANMSDTAFENADSYAAYMESHVGDSELTCLETSAGLSGDKKFIVKHGDEKIATFTLHNNSDNDIAQWVCGEIELSVTRSGSVCIGRIPGQKVYLNGIEVPDSYIVRTVSTMAENYLPEGVHGYRMDYLRVDGLLTAPQIRVVNPDGTEAVLTENAETGAFEVQHPAQSPLTEEEMLLAYNATQTYAKYMIGKTSLWNVQQYYETSSQFYKTISSAEVGWAQNAVSYGFTEAVYTELYRYSDELFSVRIDMKLQQTRGDGSVKENSLTNTLFIRKNAAGKWLVMEATNMAVQEKTTKVRITFLNGQEQLQSAMLNADAAYLDLPTITAPEGMVFAGWATLETDESGKTTVTIVYPPQEGNRVYLSAETLLEPMTLHAYFEEAGE